MDCAVTDIGNDIYSTLGNWIFFFSIESYDIRDNIYVIHGTIQKYDLLYVI